METKAVEIGTVAAGLILGAWCDWKERKIPNALTFSLIFFGFIFNFLDQGVSGTVHALLGLILGILLLYLPFSMGGVGGGDVKLLGAIGSFVGPVLILKIFLASAIFGGIFSLMVMVQKKAFQSTLRRIWGKLLCFALTQKIEPEEGVSVKTNSLRIPYAFAILAGTFLMLFVAKGG